ncbi:MAG: F0F1 ATP synthase subunit epsilon [Actinomycetota bacterium]
MAETGAHELRVSVVSADHEVWTGAASMIVAKTTEGEIGILPGHEPLLAILRAGEVRITPSSGSAAVRATADDGFLSVEHDTVMIVSRNAALVQG